MDCNEHRLKCGAQNMSNVYSCWTSRDRRKKNESKRCIFRQKLQDLPNLIQRNTLRHTRFPQSPWLIISGALLCPTFMRTFGGRALIGLLVVSGTLIVHFYLHRSPRRAPYGYSVLTRRKMLLPSSSSSSFHHTSSIHHRLFAENDIPCVPTSDVQLQIVITTT